MSLRVTPHRQLELAQANSQLHYSQGAKLQQEISSGIRISKPSDDPAGQKVVLNQQAAIQQFTTQLNSLTSARSVLSDAQTQVRDAQQLIVKAKNIALQARQSTDASNREVYASQLDSILHQLDSIANSKSNGHYLFAGSDNGSPPFTGIGDGKPTYQGSTNAAKISLIGHPDIKTYYSGQEVFQPVTGGQLAISGTTGIASGKGTSSGAATTTLTIRHTSTTYAPGSGVQAGTSSPAGDTVMGASGTHQLKINDTSGNGTSGTVSLDGGPDVHFTNTDGNLLVTGPEGQSVYINTQSITAGFHGTVDLTANGTLSIDHGTTEVPVDFSANQTLTSPDGSLVQHFDTTKLTQAGTVTVEPAATADTFQVIRSLRDTILNTNGLSDSERDANFNRSLGDLDAANNHLLNVIGEQSIDLQNLDTLEDRLNTLKLNAETLLSKVQSTDYTTAITDLQEQQNMLQFTLQSISTLSKLSILNFLK